MWSNEGPCYVIAEAGSNHDGDFDQALALIDVAFQANADAVKFQCIEPLKREWLPELQNYAQVGLGIDFLATPFDTEAVRVLDELDVPAIKIASPELTNLKLVGTAAMTPLSAGFGMVGSGAAGFGRAWSGSSGHGCIFPSLTRVRCGEAYRGGLLRFNL